MTVIIDRADGNREIFQTAQFMISQPKDMNPIICAIKVKLDNGKTVARWRRPFSAIYKKYVWKPEPMDQVPADPEQEVTVVEPGTNPESAEN